MRSFSRRAEPDDLPEKMDGETSLDVYRGTLKSLARVNALTFGSRPQLSFLERAIAHHTGDTPLTIVDIGSGYGDGARAMATYLKKRKIPARIIGVDLNPHAAQSASEVPFDGGALIELEWATADVFDYIKTAGAPDLIVSALFCHHLNSPDLPDFLRWMDRSAKRGWLINDLYRSKVAAIGFGVLTTLFRFHPYVRHDGPVSFARSFRKPDWIQLLSEASIEGAEIAIKAPFRMCIEKHV
ncbi:MAG: methyltransferase domain-containing protein [Pseudomonadota bacterium]